MCDTTMQHNDFISQLKLYAFEIINKTMNKTFVEMPKDKTKSQEFLFEFRILIKSKKMLIFYIPFKFSLLHVCFMVLHIENFHFLLYM